MGKITRNAASSVVVGTSHYFRDEEVESFRKKILLWYDLNKRELPWRSIAATEADANRRAYAVWVSEVMLQQTQVTVAAGYFERWMSRWPTVRDLAAATLEEVNQLWAGLGYYSRAQRLHEGAVKIVKEMDGNFPSDRDSLIRDLPGVGRYTGSAIASIAFNNSVGVVDGNVNRALARIRAIGSDLSDKSTIDHMWQLADELVDLKRPSDFNQAMMELGATVCTPKRPNCTSCPVQELCIAKRQTEADQDTTSIANYFSPKESCKSTKEVIVPDIECLPDCNICLRKGDWDGSLGVQNYPRKAAKIKVREQTNTVIVLKHTDGQMLLLQRPKSGLLANLWEFPSFSYENNEALTKQLSKFFSLSKKAANSCNYVGEILHVFSHIRQTYRIYKIELEGEKEAVSWPSSYQSGKWLSEEEFLRSATSTGMKKVLKAVNGWEHKVKNGKQKCSTDRKNNKRQKTEISHYFQVVPKN